MLIIVNRLINGTDKGWYDELKSVDKSKFDLIN